MATVDTLAPAAGIGCVALSAVKQRFGFLPDDATAGAELSALIEIASEICRDVIGRDPWRQVYEETTEGKGERDLYPHHWPVEGVDVVEVNGQPVDASAYRIHRRKLRRLGGAIWPRGADVLLRYRAGWVVPGQVTEWAPGALMPEGSLVPTGKRHAEATTGGTTATTPPTWPSTVGETVADGEVVWTLRATHPAPLVLQACAQSVVVLLDEGFLELEPGLVGERDGDYSVRYRATSANNQHAAVNNRVQALLRRFR